LCRGLQLTTQRNMNHPITTKLTLAIPNKNTMKNKRERKKKGMTFFYNLATVLRELFVKACVGRREERGKEKGKKKKSLIICHANTKFVKMTCTKKAREYNLGKKKEGKKKKKFKITLLKRWNKWTLQYFQMPVRQKGGEKRKKKRKSSCCLHPPLKSP